MMAVAMGDFRKAYRILSQSPLADKKDEDTARDMAVLHPSRKMPINPLHLTLPHGISAFVQDPNVTARVIPTLPKGKAADVLGCPYEELTAMYNIPGGSETINAIIASLNAGECHPSTATLLRACSLLGLSKAPKPGTRPLAIGGALTRATATCAMRQCKPQMLHWFTSNADLHALRASESNDPNLLPHTAASAVVDALVDADADAAELMAAAHARALKDSPLGSCSPSAWLAESHADPTHPDPDDPDAPPPIGPRTKAAQAAAQAHAAEARRDVAKTCGLPPNAANVPLQLGVGTPGGCEVLVHMLRALVEAHPQCGVAGNDFRNGFNETTRASIFKGLYESPFASLIPAVSLWYRESSTLVLDRDVGQLKYKGVDVCSDEGARQGCGFGSFLFCVSFHRCLTLAQRQHPDCVFLAYCDDTYVFHPTSPKAAYAALCTLRDLCIDLNKLESVPSKSFFYTPSATSDLSFLPIETEGNPMHANGRLTCFKAVGAYIGDASAVTANVKNSMAKSVSQASVLDYLFDTEHHKSASQSRLLVLRHCANSVPTFLLRNTPPAEAMPGAAVHDEAVAERLCKHIVDDHTFEADMEHALRQARLPPAMGGLGLTSAVDASRPSYAASHARSSTIARRLSPAFAAIATAAFGAGMTIPSIQAAVSAIESIAHQRRGVQATWDAWDSNPVYYEPCMGGAQYQYHPSKLPPAHLSAFQPAGLMVAMPDTMLAGLQHVYLRVLHHRNWMTLMNDALDPGFADPHYASILIDASQPGAGDYLRALPASPLTTINSDLFNLRIKRQLRLAIRSGDDPYGDELVNDSGMTARHTQVLNVLAQVATKAYGTNNVFREPPASPEFSSSWQPDLLTLQGGDGGQHRVDDVKVGSSYGAKVKDGAPNSDNRRWCASRVAFSQIGPRFIKKCRGFEQVGEPGDGRFNYLTGHGYRKATSRVDYAGALNKGIEVGVLTFNPFGGRSPEADAWWRKAIRHTGSHLSQAEAGVSATARNFAAFHAQHLSCGLSREVSAQIQRGLMAELTGTIRSKRYKPSPTKVARRLHLRKLQKLQSVRSSAPQDSSPQISESTLTPDSGDESSDGDASPNAILRDAQAALVHAATEPAPIHPTQRITPAAAMALLTATLASPNASATLPRAATPIRATISASTSVQATKPRSTNSDMLSRKAPTTTDYNPPPSRITTPTSPRLEVTPAVTRRATAAAEPACSDPNHSGVSASGVPTYPAE